MYLLTCSKVSVGTNTRSPGCPRLAGAYSITKYSLVIPPMVRCTISTYLPIPCCSCTTKSPARSSSGSTACLRLDGMRAPSFAEALLPVKSRSVIKRIFAASDENPCAIADCVMCTEAFVGIARSSGTITTGKSALRKMPA